MKDPRHVNMVMPKEDYEKIRQDAYYNNVLFSEMLRRIIREHYRSHEVATTPVNIVKVGQ